MKIFAFLLLAAVLSATQDRPDARDLLSRADAPLFTAKTVRLFATRSQNFVGSSPMPVGQFKIEFVRDGKGRFEYLSGNTTISLSIFDGTSRWDYHQLGNQYTQTPASAFGTQSEIVTIDYGRRNGNILSASYQPDETIDYRGGRAECYVVLAKYPHAQGIQGGGEAMRRTWISKDSELILRDYWEAVNSLMRVGEMITTNYTDIETGIPLPDDLFVFQPPPGSKSGPAMVLGGIIGNVPAAPRTLRSKVAPEYPPEARTAGVQGSVILAIEVAPDGRPQHPRIIHGLGMGLDESAVEAVKQWRYDTDANPNAAPLRRAVEVLFRLTPAAPWVLDGSVFRTQRPSGPGVTTEPEMRQYVAPDPQACSVQGYVIVNLAIGSNGVPTEIQPAPENAGAVGDAVVQAIQSWRFKPGTLDGSNSAGTGRVVLECRPAEAPSPAGQIYSGAVVTQPAILFKPEPAYSEEARRAKLQGEVSMNMTVEPDGKASGVRVVHSLGLGLDEQAIGAALQWRFKPGTKDGKPVRVNATVTVSFRLL